MIYKPFDTIVVMQLRNEGRITETVDKGVTKFCELESFSLLG